jgi:hypothetical protein
MRSSTCARAEAATERQLSEYRAANYRPEGAVAPYTNRTFNRKVAMLGYLITSSARAMSDCGIVMRRAFAVLRLSESTNLVGC